MEDKIDPKSQEEGVPDELPAEEVEGAGEESLKEGEGTLPEVLQGAVDESGTIPIELTEWQLLEPGERHPAGRKAPPIPGRESKTVGMGPTQEPDWLKGEQGRPFKAHTPEDEKRAVRVKRGWAQLPDGRWVGKNGRPVGRPKDPTKGSPRAIYEFFRGERGVLPKTKEGEYETNFVPPSSPIPADDDQINQSIYRLKVISTGKTKSDKGIYIIERRKLVRTLLYQGFANNEIADRIGISRRTVWFDIEAIRRYEEERLEGVIDQREKFRWLETSLGAFLDIQFRTRDRVARELIEKEAESLQAGGGTGEGKGGKGSFKRTMLRKKSPNWGALTSMDRNILETYDRFTQLYGLAQGTEKAQAGGGTPKLSVAESVRDTMKSLNPTEIRMRLLDIAGKRGSGNGSP